MTLKDLTLVMDADEKIVVYYKGDIIFTGLVDTFYNDYIVYKGVEVDTSQFLDKVVSNVAINNIYNAIWVEIED